MKKLIITALSIMLFCGCISVQADDSKKTLLELNIIDDNYFSNPNSVTRYECLVAVMRAIGQTDEAIEWYYEHAGDYIGFADNWYYEHTNDNNVLVHNYPYAALAFGKIACGEECKVDFTTDRTRYTRKDTDYFFFPDREVTVKETLAFMVRCLEEFNQDQNLDYTFEKAKEYGLINSKDVFFKTPDSFITQSDFCVLLERFLNQKMYKFCNRFGEDYIGAIRVIENNEQGITYLEYLQNNRQLDDSIIDTHCR